MRRLTVGRRFGRAGVAAALIQDRYYQHGECAEHDTLSTWRHLAGGRRSAGECCQWCRGRGVALQFKNAYPANFEAYEAACRRGDVRPGCMFVFATGRQTNPKYIINFPTKRHWRGRSRTEDIGLGALATEVRTRHIRSIALPALGSGLGGLVWRDVRLRIEGALNALNDVQVIVYEPQDDGPRVLV